MYEQRFVTYKLTATIGFTLVVLMLLSLWTFYAYADFSINRARAIRSDLFDRDLRDLANRFDTDERFVLEHNLPVLLTDNRRLSPLLLPRPYYTAIPTRKISPFPRQPPRNCFVSLIPQDDRHSLSSSSDRFCAYFVENEAFGHYLFLAIDVADKNVVPLRYGDSRLIGDSLRLSIGIGSRRETWWITYRQPVKSDPERYEVSAYRELPNGVKELDRRLEGWAYTQRQSDGTQVIKVIARLNFKQFEKEEAVWPPPQWQKVNLAISRTDYASATEPPSVIHYADTGASNLSVASLAQVMFSARARLDIITTKASEFGHRSWHVMDPQLGKSPESRFFKNFVDGDVVINVNPLVRSQLLPDTNIYFQIEHPGIVIEKEVWRVAVLVVALTIAALGAVGYSGWRLLIPVLFLAVHVRRLIAKGADRERLPFETRNDEIGILSRGFNELIDKIREQVVRELADRTAREAAENLRLKAVLQNRDENLKIIGHEIRSPLQALVNLHPSGTDARRYIDRILSALPHLQLGLAAEDAIAAREIELSPVELNEFLSEIARNAGLVNVPDVLFVGALADLVCDVDADALGDVLENIIRNAHRHRLPGTPITITLTKVGTHAVITISNHGNLIDEAVLDRIFDYGFSTVAKKFGDGNGIGLWISRKYVSMMRGSLTVLNIRDEGRVCFEISLPVFALADASAV
jgi:signal transduction histidine kinase